MEIFCDDELGLVLKWIANSVDRKSCSEVCKQWARVEGFTRTSLRVLEPESLHNFLPRFPKLITFKTEKRISDTNLEFIAHTCPSLRTLNLSIRQGRRRRVLEEGAGLGLDDVGDDGLCDISIGCRHLTKVLLRRRRGIGSIGVLALMRSAQNLAVLDLSWCTSITDQALEAIGATSSLMVLNLRGCWLITDSGLASLATGSLSRTLRKLDLSECDNISDQGIFLLQRMSRLQDLKLAECGPRITDIRGVVIAASCTLKTLDFSWLINLSNAALLVVAQYCQDLVKLKVTGCELITGVGIRSFASHDSLEILVLAHCGNVHVDDIEQTVLECQSLRFVGLDKALRGRMSAAVQEKLSRLCRLGWL